MVTLIINYIDPVKGTLAASAGTSLFARRLPLPIRLLARRPASGVPQEAGPNLRPPGHDTGPRGMDVCLSCCARV